MARKTNKQALHLLLLVLTQQKNENRAQKESLCAA